MKTDNLLKNIHSPSDLKKLSLEQLPKVCSELRQFILESVSQTGGHLASGLGVIELTVAIHYVFNTPEDSLVWDVGHQAYPHKVLTGRRDQLSSIKKQGGLSGFPKRSESEYDDFGVGHSSTSISAALGMAISDQILGKQAEHIAVIGDGAMTAGIAFEAIHHAASLSANLLVILNDNDMSISPNVGGFSSYLSKILVSDLYHGVRNKSKEILKHLPPFNDLAKFAENRVKEIANGNNLFEDFGFDYSGPVDGHDVLLLVRTLQEMQGETGPRILHIKTKKGKGYERAEASPIAYHGVSRFDLSEGVIQPVQSINYTEVFSNWLCKRAEQSEKLVGITPAMREGSGLVEFSRRYPSRYFDVAIAEQHALTLAAGIACKGLKPVVAIYSTFLQRAYDQLIHDIALQDLDVLLAIDRAGIVGADGATHAGSFDIAFSQCIPGLVIMTPSNADEMNQMLDLGYDYCGPALVRYPKEKVADTVINQETPPVELGQANLVLSGCGLAILVFGTLLNDCKAIAEKVGASLVDMRFVKPFDQKMLSNLLTNHHRFLLIEEGCILGGVGQTIACYLQENSHDQLISTHLLGITDEFVEHGTRQEVLETYQLSQEKLEDYILELAEMNESKN